ncbi:MAG TPA: SIR2 family protein [Actinophytocola sp.]|uniref:P-loop NTPase n=1 Tax=Actinophytocola sp. TaxID=1872138 RepID=UPI002DDCF2B8|nr:SIR2 family protein [Actinophytocola sp.]HEV2784453.1 SIR2 family protein [Actinophytocola sp.]
MPNFPIGDEVALRSRLLYLLKESEKPIAFVVGSGLTVGTVPGVGEMVTSMRKSLEDPDDMARFDAAVNQTVPSQRYQKAAEFIFLNRGQKLLNRIIRLSVLRACADVSVAEKRQVVDIEETLKNLELEASWRMDKGVSALGRLLTAMPADIRGPVLTTNFDPLIEVAVRNAGGTPHTQVLDDDGKIEAASLPGAITIAHMHGLWRRGDTLHFQHQLDRERPMLDGAIRSALAGHAVVVLGYGGWTDIFTKSLIERTKERDFMGMELLWGSYSTLASGEESIGVLSAIGGSNSVSVYQGIDANIFLPYVTGMHLDRVGRVPLSGVLDRWTHVTSRFLQLRSETPTVEHRLRFFDGVQPDWRAAMDPDVPKLSAVGRFLAKVRDELRQRTSGLVLLTGPMGEGKSIALRQAVATLATGEDRDAYSIYWREPGGLLNPGVIDSLPRDGRKHLLCSDEADLLVEAIVRLADVLSGRDDIFLLLCAQERDWRERGAFARISHTKVVTVSGMSEPDARALIGAWEACGERGLGDLYRFDPAKRLEVVLSAAHDAVVGTDSLIAAMLSLRFGTTVQDRVADLLSRLEQRPVVGALSLAEVFLMIAYVDLHTRDGGGYALSRRILARTMGVDEDAIEYLVVQPLGKEAAVVAHGGYIYTRHRSIAEAAISVARRDRPKTLHAALRAVVTGAVLDAKERNAFAEDHHAVAYLGGKVDDIDEALIIIDTAIAADPKRLAYRNERVHLLRKTDPEAAYAYGLEVYRSISSFDPNSSVAVFLVEWGVAAGKADRPTENVWLALASLVGPHGRITNDSFVESPTTGVARSLHGLAEGLTAIHRAKGDKTLLLGIAAIAKIVLNISNDGTDIRFAKMHAAYAKRNKVELTALGGKDGSDTDLVAYLEKALSKLPVPPEYATMLDETSHTLQPLRDWIKHND